MRRIVEASIVGLLLAMALASVMTWTNELATQRRGAQAAGLPDQRTVIVEAKLRPARFYQAPATTLATVYHPLIPDGVTEARY